MPSSKEDREKQRKQNNEDTEHALRELWNIRPSTLFYNPFKRNFERDINDIFDAHATCADDEIKVDFHASELEVREIKTLCFYSHYFFCENRNKPIKRFSNITKEDYIEFEHNPRLWKRLDSHQQATLQSYLNSIILEIEEPDVELPEFDDSTFSSNAHPFEDNLTDIEFEDDMTAIIEENSVESFEHVQEHISSSVGGPADPHQDSFSTMGGPPDPQRKRSSPMSGPPDPLSSSLHIESCHSKQFIFF